METVDKIKDQIASNDVILYMKGSPQLPQCGFSSRVVAALKTYDTDFAYVDVLANPDIRQALPTVANWPTFPQLYIKGELVGGCDIVMQLHETGELKKLFEAIS